MFLLRRMGAYLREVVDTVREVLAADDPLLCDCLDDRWCADCALLSDSATPLPWPAAAFDASPCDAA